ncbi:MAG: transposase [Gemmatimonadaceae bacterium]
MKRSRTSTAERRERRAFSAEFKAEAVRMMAARRDAGATLAQVGRELDVRPDQLRAWARQLGHQTVGVPGVPGETLEQENRRLRREVETLRQEQAFAKKVAVGSTDECNTSDLTDSSEVVESKNSEVRLSAGCR